MLDALAEFFPSESEWTPAGGGLFIWATLPEYIDTTTCSPGAGRQRRLRARPRAYLDGRGGSSMRLKLLGGRPRRHPRGSAAHRQKVVREQVELFGTLTGARPAEPASAAPEPEAPDNVLELPRRQQRREAR